MIGQRFERLTIIRKSDGRYYLCRCDCGNEKRVRKDHLVGGKTRSCGCLRSEITAKNRTKHGMYGTKVYRTWSHIKTRCNNKNNDNYKYYGGRGIKVDLEWSASFAAFYRAVGDPPTDAHTIDRIDVDGNYEYGNVRWATREEQQANTTATEYITIGKRALRPRVWCNEFGIKFSTYRSRIGRGWDKVEALTFPIVSPKDRGAHRHRRK